MNIIKKINGVSEVKNFFSNTAKDQIPDNLIDLFQNFIACKKIQDLGKIKKKGFEGINILTTLLIFPFAGIASIRALFLSGLYDSDSGEKDVYYRFKNNESINWRSTLYSVAKRFRFLVKKNSEADNSENSSSKCLIADDTVLRKTGKKIENIGKVHDHVGGSNMVLGYKMLALTFWDGVSNIPLDFSIHNEKGKNKKRPFGLSIKASNERFSKTRDICSPGYKRNKEVRNSKIDTLIEMIKRAVKHGFTPDYVLTDSWFSCEKLIKIIRKLKKGSIHFLGPMKINRVFTYNGKNYSGKKLRQKLRKNIKRCRSLKSFYIKTTVTYHGIKLCLFFNRSHGSEKWHLIVTTNLNLNFPEALKTYSIRWAIEVFFKESKQYFGLGKSQAQDFDSQIADSTITFIQLTMLTYLKRFQDYETLGMAFTNVKEFVLEYTLVERIWGMIFEILRKIATQFEMSFEKIMKKIYQSPEFEATIFKIIGEDFFESDKKPAIPNFNNAI